MCNSNRNTKNHGFKIFHQSLFLGIRKQNQTQWPLHNLIHISIFIYVYIIFIYLLIFGCTEPLLLGTDFLSPQQVGPLFFEACRLLIVVASLIVALGCTGCGGCGREAQQSQLPCSGAQARQLRHRLRCSAACGLFLDPGSNHVPCIDRWILIHWATREVPHISVLFKPQLFVLPKKPRHLVCPGGSRLIPAVQRNF